MRLGTYNIADSEFLRAYTPQIIGVPDSGEKYPCDVLIWNNNYDFHSYMLSNFPNLKLFINWGTDDGNLKDEEDLQRKVALKKVDFYAQESMCEYVLMLMVAFEQAQEKDFNHETFDHTKQLHGKKIGMLGLGKIGFAVADLLHETFHCTIQYNTTEDHGLPHYSFASKEEMFRNCDYVIIAAKSKNCSVETSLLGFANPNLVILNISRDSILPFAAIYPYIRDHKIRGFIGDMTDVKVEKDVTKHVLIAPKTGYRTEEAVGIKQNIALLYLKQYVLREERRKSYVYIVRHGETEWNVQKIYQGIYDSPLTLAGKRQARKEAELLANKKVTHIFTSPLGRAQETALILSQLLTVPITTVGIFKEMDFGIFQQRSQQQMQKLFADFFTNRKKNPYYKLFVPYPAGESYFDIYLRILAAVMDIAVHYDDFLIVGHESVNRMIRGIILGRSLADMVKQRQKNDEIVIIEISENSEKTIST